MCSWCCLVFFFVFLVVFFDSFPELPPPPPAVEKSSHCSKAFRDDDECIVVIVVFIYVVAVGLRAFWRQNQRDRYEGFLWGLKIGEFPFISLSLSNASARVVIFYRFSCCFVWIQLHFSRLSGVLCVRMYIYTRSLSLSSLKNSSEKKRALARWSPLIEKLKIKTIHLSWSVR